jgi:hypothetical protein
MIHAFSPVTFEEFIESSRETRTDGIISRIDEASLG